MITTIVAAALLSAPSATAPATPSRSLKHRATSSSSTPGNPSRSRPARLTPGRRASRPSAALSSRRSLSAGFRRTRTFSRCAAGPSRGRTGRSRTLSRSWPATVVTSPFGGPTRWRRRAGKSARTFEVSGIGCGALSRDRLVQPESRDRQLRSRGHVRPSGPAKANPTGDPRRRTGHEPPGGPVPSRRFLAGLPRDARLDSRGDRRGPVPESLSPHSWRAHPADSPVVPTSWRIAWIGRSGRVFETRDSASIQSSGLAKPRPDLRKQGLKEQVHGSPTRTASLPPASCLLSPGLTNHARITATGFTCSAYRPVTRET